MEKVKNQMQISVPQDGFVDEGDGVVSFPNGLTITDNSVQRNGTTYDIETLDITKYGRQLTGDHEDKLSSLIGEVVGVVKTDSRVFVNKIRYAVKENPYARLAYNLLVGGFSKNFSIETIGPAPDEYTGVYYNAELVGLSQVVTQNNYNAHVNQFNKVVHNSLEQSRADGLDVDGIEDKILNKAANDLAASKPEEKPVEEEQKMENENKKAETDETKAVKTKETEVEAKAETNETSKTEEVKEEVGAENSVKETAVKVELDTDKIKTAVNEAFEESFAKLKAENQAEEEVEKTTETETEETKTETETQENEVDDTTEESVEEKETNKEDKMSKTENASLTTEQVSEIIANALKPVTEELAVVKEQATNAFNASAKEPEFKKAENETKEEAKDKNDYAAMDWRDRYQAQVNAAWGAVKVGNVAAIQTLNQINRVNFEKGKEAGIYTNQITLDDLGNFVLAPEMYDQIVGQRNDYTALLEATEWRETNSLEFAWLKRVGDIDMQPVAIGTAYDWHDGAGEPDGTDDQRLKPVSEYSAVPKVSRLEELAAVTVVATSTTRFAAVDLLADAAAGYRTDYDRKRAELVIAKLEEAVDETGYSTAYNPSDDEAALTTWLTAIASISDTTLNGTLVFNAKTYAELRKRAVAGGLNGPLSEILITGDVPTIYGYRYIIVPNDLMPSLGGSETIVHQVDGENKTINHAVFFADLTTFTGRTSGGLQYDISTQASYETGGTVKSAYQRNELVLRGSFFRGGAVRDPQVVAGIRQGNSANAS